MLSLKPWKPDRVALLFGALLVPCFYKTSREKPQLLDVVLSLYEKINSFHHNFEFPHWGHLRFTNAPALLVQEFRLLLRALFDSLSQLVRQSADRDGLQHTL